MKIPRSLDDGFCYVRPPSIPMVDSPISLPLTFYLNTLLHEKNELLL